MNSYHETAASFCPHLRTVTDGKLVGFRQFNGTLLVDGALQ